MCTNTVQKLEPICYTNMNKNTMCKHNAQNTKMRKKHKMLLTSMKNNVQNHNVQNMRKTHTKIKKEEKREPVIKKRKKCKNK